MSISNIHKILKVTFNCLKLGVKILAKSVALKVNNYGVNANHSNVCIVLYDKERDSGRYSDVLVVIFEDKIF